MEKGVNLFRISLSQVTIPAIISLEKSVFFGEQDLFPYIRIWKREGRVSETRSGARQEKIELAAMGVNGDVRLLFNEVGRLNTEI